MVYIHLIAKSPTWMCIYERKMFQPIIMFSLKFKLRKYNKLTNHMMMLIMFLLWVTSWFSSRNLHLMKSRPYETWLRYCAIWAKINNFIIKQVNQFLVRLWIKGCTIWFLKPLENFSWYLRKMSIKYTWTQFYKLWVKISFSSASLHNLQN